MGTTEELPPESEAHRDTWLPGPTRDTPTSQWPATCPSSNPGVLLEPSLSQGLLAIPLDSPAQQATFLSTKGVPHVLTTGRLECLALGGCHQAVGHGACSPSAPAHTGLLLWRQDRAAGLSGVSQQVTSGLGTCP